MHKIKAGNIAHAKDKKNSLARACYLLILASALPLAAHAADARAEADDRARALVAKMTPD